MTIAVHESSPINKKITYIYHIKNIYNKIRLLCSFTYSKQISMQSRSNKRRSKFLEKKVSLRVEPGSLKLARPNQDLTVNGRDNNTSLWLTDMR